MAPREEKRLRREITNNTRRPRSSFSVSLLADTQGNVTWRGSFFFGRTPLCLLWHFVSGVARGWWKASCQGHKFGCRWKGFAGAIPTPAELSASALPSPTRHGSRPRRRWRPRCNPPEIPGIWRPVSVPFLPRFARFLRGAAARAPARVAPVDGGKWVIRGSL